MLGFYAVVTQPTPHSGLNSATWATSTGPGGVCMHDEGSVASFFNTQAWPTVLTQVTDTRAHSRDLPDTGVPASHKQPLNSRPSRL